MQMWSIASQDNKKLQKHETKTTDNNATMAERQQPLVVTHHIVHD